MSAYVIGDINVTDSEIYAKYADRVPASSGAFGCKYLVRGLGKCQTAEGDWLPERFVLAEYKDVETEYDRAPDPTSSTRWIQRGRGGYAWVDRSGRCARGMPVENLDEPVESQGDPS